MVQFTFPSIYAGSQGLTWLWSPSLQDNTPTLNKRGIFFTYSVYYFTHIISSPGANSRYSKTAPCRSRTGETRWISPICQHWREYSKLGVADTARPSDAKCIMSQFIKLIWTIISSNPWIKCTIIT